MEEELCLDVDTGKVLNEGVSFSAEPLKKWEGQLWPVHFHQVMDTASFNQLSHATIVIFSELIHMMAPANWLVIDPNRVMIDKRQSDSCVWEIPELVNSAVDALTDHQMIVGASDSPSLPDVFRDDPRPILRVNPFYFWRGPLKELNRARAWWLQTTC